MSQEIEQIRFVLASASPRRAELLRQIGIESEVIPSRIEEKITSAEPSRIVMELSRQKAEEVAERIGEAAENPEGSAERPGESAGRLGKMNDSRTVVIGSDTVVSSGGQILGKPSDRQAARAMLIQLQGKSHDVYTGVTLIGAGKKRTFSVGTKVEVYPMTEQEIEDYLDTGESMDKAGAYGIQGRFAAYIKGIEGSYTNVVGLPVGRLYQEIKQLLADQPEEQE